MNSTNDTFFNIDFEDGFYQDQDFWNLSIDCLEKKQNIQLSNNGKLKKIIQVLISKEYSK